MDIRRIFGAPQPVETETIQEQIQTTQDPQQPVGLSPQDSLESAVVQQTSNQITGGKLETKIPDLERFLNFHDGFGDESDIARIINYFGGSITTDQVKQMLGENHFSPEDILNIYRNQGLEAEGYNNSTFEQLASFIDNGMVVQASVKEHSFDVSEMITITGHGVDNSRTPPQEYITYLDAAGNEKRMSRATFEEQWARGGCGAGTMDYGFHNYMQVIGPPGSNLPAGGDEGVEAITTFETGYTEMFHGSDLLLHGDGIGERTKGLFECAGGGVKFLGGLAGFALFSGPAQFFGKAVEGIPVLENVVQPLTDIWDTGGAVIGDIFNGLGSAIDDWGGAFGSLFEGDFVGFSRGLYEGAADLGNAVVDAVTDAVEGVVDAVGDFFSGW